MCSSGYVSSLNGPPAALPRVCVCVSQEPAQSGGTVCLYFALHPGPPAHRAPPALCIGMPACASDGCYDGGPGAEFPDRHDGTDGADCANYGMRQPLPMPTAGSPPGKGICLETCFPSVHSHSYAFHLLPTSIGQTWHQTLFA